MPRLANGSSHAPLRYEVWLPPCLPLLAALARRWHAASTTMARLAGAVAEPVWDAVPGLLLVRLATPLAGPAAPVSWQRALHGACHSGVVRQGPGPGILLPR